MADGRISCVFCVVLSVWLSDRLRWAIDDDRDNDRDNDGRIDNDRDDDQDDDRRGRRWQRRWGMRSYVFTNAD